MSPSTGKHFSEIAEARRDFDMGLSDNGEFERFKQQLIEEINALHIEGLPKVVAEPRFVAKPRMNLRGSVTVSDGVRSSATMMTGLDI